MADKKILTIKGKPENKIDCIAWLLLNVFGCDFCKTCRGKSCKIKDGECCTDNIAKYIRETVIKEADVVPRNEVARLEAQIRRLKAYDEERDIALHQRLVRETKQEVAKKMIDEFEFNIEYMHESAKITGDIMFYWKTLKAELKKKYIGE